MKEQSEMLAKSMVSHKDEVLCDLIGCSNNLQELEIYKGRLFVIVGGDKSETYFLDSQPLVKFFPASFEIKQGETNISLVGNQKYQVLTPPL